VILFGIKPNVIIFDDIEKEPIMSSRSIGFVNVIDPVSKEIVSIRYNEFVEKLFKPGADLQADLNHGVIGCAGEVGELCDAVKKFTIYGKEIDIANIIEELGDLRFYETSLMNKLGIPEQSVLQANANKLAKRYSGLIYSDKAAIERADKTEEKK
jgi:NTP pyrophosphatase (non-canonical NTP hydrolase)